MDYIDFKKTVARKMGVPTSHANRYLRPTWEALRDVLIRGDKVSIPNFATFYTKDMPARQVKDINTGETLDLAVMRSPRARFSTGLKAKISEMTETKEPKDA